ncbi:MAG: hypothetical protein K8S62_09235 [Candidatus Sabulitectum sp.]|nr:hypothetical protein [Candidatus Sabulitectum sp.]
MTALLLAVLTSFSPGRGSTGLGLIAGNPTGISFKYFTSTTRAIDAAAAWSFSDEWMMIHSNYLWHSFGDLNVSKGQLPWYYGLGGWVAFGDDVVAGGRVPIGIEYLFANQDIDMFLEVAAGISIIPDSEFYVDAALGIRFFF